MNGKRTQGKYETHLRKDWNKVYEQIKELSTL